MSTLLSIDPGDEESALTFLDVETRRPLWVKKLPNAEALAILCGLGPAEPGALMLETTHVAIEMIASYGMVVGAEIFDTCVWIGRFAQALEDWRQITPVLVFRREVKLHHCMDPRAKDTNVTHALVDRFAKGQTNMGKGTKAKPGWFFGFAKDIWQAYALGVLEADRLKNSHDNVRSAS